MSNRYVQLKRGLRILTGSEKVVSSKLHARHLAARSANSVWLSHPGVQGLGIGRKTTNGRPKRALALLVYVERKLPLSELEQPIPRSIRLPGIRAQLPIDVVEIGKVRLQGIQSVQEQPTPPGVGVGRDGRLGGTLGCLVRANGNAADLYILSNYHVLAGAGSAVDDEILHPPSLPVAGDSPRPFAQLKAWETPQSSPDTYPNLIDAAIARVIDPSSVTSYIPWIGVPVGITGDVFAGLTVQKTGYATGRTLAQVVSVDAHIRINESLPDGTVVQAGFDHQVQCTNFTADGDSGAVVLNLKREIVGLHFAGSAQASFFSRIGIVTKKLGIEVVTEDL